MVEERDLILERFGWRLQKYYLFLLPKILSRPHCFEEIWLEAPRGRNYLRDLAGDSKSISNPSKT